MINYSLSLLINYLGLDIEQISKAHGDDSFDVPINHLRIDSRLVMKNDVFIALKGQNYDGANFIASAIESGALAAIVEVNDKNFDKIISYENYQTKTIPLIHIYQLSQKLSALADDFYHSPSKNMPVIGVTGTNGKTTVAQLIAQWVDLLGEKSAVLGTIGNGLYAKLENAENTTPSPVVIQRYLAEFLAQKVKLTVMEVSSHGLSLGRVKDISFAATAYTNLSRDHLDFHGTMQDYQAAKWGLFALDKDEKKVLSSGQRIINYDDKVGRQWIEKLDKVVAVSAKPENLDEIKKLNQLFVGVTQCQFHQRGVRIDFESSWGKGQLESHLLGEFNISNLLIAFATLLSLGFPLSQLLRSSHHLEPIQGRMEVFHVKDKATIVVDYAHTPDALDNVLKTIKSHCQGKIWVVFGCGGDRDKGKRPLMAKIAQQYTENIVVTNDNPRTEDEQAIIDDIMAGFSEVVREKVQIHIDREEAIKLAITHSDQNDMVVVVGKGHEDYQIIGRTKYHYSDREVVAKISGITL